MGISEGPSCLPRVSLNELLEAQEAREEIGGSTDGIREERGGQRKGGLGRKKKYTRVLALRGGPH